MDSRGTCVEVGNRLCLFSSNLARRIILLVRLLVSSLMTSSCESYLWLWAWIAMNGCLTGVKVDLQEGVGQSLFHQI